MTSDEVFTDLSEYRDSSLHWDGADDPAVIQYIIGRSECPHCPKRANTDACSDDVRDHMSYLSFPTTSDISAVIVGPHFRT